jgi:hypothetical protein
MCLIAGRREQLQPRLEERRSWDGEYTHQAYHVPRDTRQHAHLMDPRIRVISRSCTSLRRWRRRLVVAQRKFELLWP